MYIIKVVKGILNYLLYFFGITLPIVKHSYVVRNPKDISRIVAEAFFIAKEGRPGPVLIDIPKDVGLEVFDYHPINVGKINLPGYQFEVTTSDKQLQAAANLIKHSSQPVLYVGGGAIISNAYQQVKELVEICQVPITTTLMGKGSMIRIKLI